MRHYLRRGKSAVTRERDSCHVEGSAGRKRLTRVVYGFEPFNHVVDFTFCFFLATAVYFSRRR